MTDVEVEEASPEMRDRIITAGYKMLLQFGESKTSMGDIADAAGVSRGTVYRYFGDRDQMLDAVIEHSSHAYWDAIDARVQDDMTLAEKLEARVRTSQLFSKGLKDQLESGVVDLYRRMLNDDLERTAKLSVERTLPMLRIAQDRGELREGLDLNVAADYITRVVLSTIWLPYSTVIDITDDDAVAKYVREMVMGGIGA
jgi:AcrR family transcriptional regulator